MVIKKIYNIKKYIHNNRFILNLNKGMVFTNQENNFNKNPYKNSLTPNNKTLAIKLISNSCQSISKHPVHRHILIIKFKTKIKIKKVYRDTSTMKNCLNKF